MPGSDLAVGQVEVDGEVAAVFGLVPATCDGAGVVAYLSRKALRKGIAVTLEDPLAIRPVPGSR